MSKKSSTAEATKNSNGPTHSLYHIEDRGTDVKPFWTEVAVGWENSDGSVNVRTNVGAVLMLGQTYQLRARKSTETPD